MSKMKAAHWHAVYRVKPFTKLVAIFPEEQDAREYHCAPDTFTNLRRAVIYSPAPIRVIEESEAVSLLRAIVEGTDTEMLEALARARWLLKSPPA